MQLRNGSLLSSRQWGALLNPNCKELAETKLNENIIKHPDPAHLTVPWFPPTEQSGILFIIPGFTKKRIGYGVSNAHDESAEQTIIFSSLV